MNPGSWISLHRWSDTNSCNSATGVNIRKENISITKATRERACIEEGKIELIVEPEAGSDEEVKTNIIEAPESFGALSIGYELRRMSSAKCLTDCILLGFFKPDFETLRDRHPKIAVKFLETLSMIAMKQLEKTTKALVEARGMASAFSIQFSTYYDTEREEEII